VLLLSDRIDEWVATSLTEFDGKPLRSVAQGRARLGRARRCGRKGGSRNARRPR
jgi:HSP90 family molecular chaperone